jgi:hypothetical protein
VTSTRSAARSHIRSTNRTGLPQILHLRGCQRPRKTAPAGWTGTYLAKDHAPRKVPTMRLRLHGTSPEIAAAVAALREVFDIDTASRPYPDRPPSTLVRVYLNVTSSDRIGKESQ